MMTIPEVTDADMAFGGCKGVLPAWDVIPDSFRHGRGPFCDAASSLFYSKLTDHGLTPKPGVDERKVYRVLKACLGSFEPKHEHKIGGVGYLLSQWYDVNPWSGA